MEPGTKSTLSMRAEHVRRRVASGGSYVVVSKGGVSRDAGLSDADRERSRAALADALGAVAGALPWAGEAGGLRLEDRRADGPHYPRTLYVGDRLVAAFADSWVLETIAEGEGALAREVAGCVERSGIERHLREHGELLARDAGR